MDNEYRRIQVLRDSVARKIAAGEVIDRPQSALRELLDNAIDAGAGRVDVRWEHGGLKTLEVADDGSGMERSDLEVCWLPHATSKIATETDLETLTSLGFRGEALSSIAACSRLTIVSGRSEGPAHRLTVDEGRPVLVPAAGLQGTRVLVEDLFATLPARRKFLKSTAAEGTLCRRTWDEKALSSPGISFTLRVDGVHKANYPAQTEQERVSAVLGSTWNPNTMLSWQGGGDGFSIRGYALKPPASRSDRRAIRVYANRRPLQEFALVQAVCHAFEGYLPGGAYPEAVLFIDVEPSLVDFNIHPAKREARFRTLPAIHQAVVASLRSVLEREQLRFYGTESAEPAPQASLAFDTPADAAPQFRGRAQLPAVAEWDLPAPIADEVRESPSEAFRYLGQVLGVFLVAEVGDQLYLVDQHAAHERILYDAFRDHGGRVQELLLPRRFTVEEEASALLETQWKDYEALGIRLKPLGGGEYDLLSLPQTVAGQEQTLIDFLRTNIKPVGDVETALYARLSCRAAVMDGDPLDPVTARELLKKTFALKHARCPHGRPVWTTISRNELFAKVGRLV